MRRQEDVGLQSATDGEFRRASWHMDFIYQLDGITKEAGHIAVNFHNEEGEIEFTPAALHVDGKLGVSRRSSATTFASCRDTVTTAVPKLTIPSPSMVHYRGGKAAIDPDVYPDLDAFWADLTAAYREEVRRLGELGCTYLQFDDTSLAYMNDPHQREYVASIGGDPERQHVEYIHHINEALAGPPGGDGRHDAHVPRQLPLLLGGRGRLRLRRRGALQRARGRRLLHGVGRRALGRLRAAPLPAAGKQVVLGLVTTKRGELEAKDELKRRIEEASKYATLEQLCLSPQCGFSSTVEGNALTVDEQFAKLALIVEAADEVWG